MASALGFGLCKHAAQRFQFIANNQTSKNAKYEITACLIALYDLDATEKQSDFCGMKNIFFIYLLVYNLRSSPYSLFRHLANILWSQEFWRPDINSIIPEGRPPSHFWLSFDLRNEGDTSLCLHWNLGKYLVIKQSKHVNQLLTIARMLSDTERV